MNLTALKLPDKLQPYKGVILFMLILMLSNFFWKYNVKGDEASYVDSTVTFWGLNISAPFVWLAHNTAHVTLAIMHFFGSDATLEPVNLIHHTNGHSVLIVWACTGLKQAYIFFCVIAFNRGSLVKKMWFIPAGLIVIYLFNIFRITVIASLIENHPDWFDFLHFYLFKYIFYGIIFLMWVLWEEKFASKKLPLTSPTE